MALQLRRGTDAERQSITPVEGELIYTTDTNQLYVGGVIAPSTNLTQGGILVSGSLANDTSPTLSANLNLNAHDITGVGNINIDGTITATGNINLGDGAEDNVIVGGQISSSLIPRANDTYDLGVSVSRWRNVSANGGNFDGEVVVGNLITDGNITKSDSTVIYDAATDTVTANAFVGVLQGSVFADDSTLMVDSGTNSINAISVDTDSINAISVATDSIVSSNTGRLSIGSGASPLANTLLHSNNFNIYGPVDSVYSTINAFNGNFNSPSIVAAGEVLGTNSFTGYDGVEQTTSGVTRWQVDDDPITPIGAGNIPGKFVLASLQDGDSGVGAGTFAAMTFDSKGRLGVNHTDLSANYNVDVNGTVGISGSLTVGRLTSVEVAALTPENGMMVYDTDTHKFRGYANGTWVDLH